MTFEAVSGVFQSLLESNILPLVVQEISKENCVLSFLFPKQELDSLAHHQSRDKRGSKGRVSKSLLDSLPFRSVDRVPTASFRRSQHSP